MAEVSPRYSKDSSLLNGVLTSSTDTLLHAVRIWIVDDLKDHQLWSIKLAHNLLFSAVFCWVN
jgi:hypothetical protein